MGFFDASTLPRKEAFAGISVCSAHLPNVMITHFIFEPGAVAPGHDHPHEQISFILEGEMEFTLAGETRVLTAGQGVTIPPGLRHGARALTRTLVLDAWSPVRSDYIL